MCSALKDKVIGGEFAIQLETLSVEGIHRDSSTDDSNKFLTRYIYSSGRTALHAILGDLKKRDCQTIFLPDYLCGSVFLPVERQEFTYHFYHVDENFESVLGEIDMADVINAAILFINYFGMVDLVTAVQSIRLQFPSIWIVIDNVQCYYGTDVFDYDYAFTSWRKWFPVPDGAEVWCKHKGSEGLEQFMEESIFAKYKIAGNILKNYSDTVGDEICLELLEQGEKILDENYLVDCTKTSQHIMEGLDRKLAANKRRVNAEYLHTGLKEMNIIHLYRGDVVPLFVPILLESNGQRDSLRKKMFANNIFCPIHWPEDERIKGRNTLYDRELSLICDQRYGTEEMERILEIIRSEM